MCGICGCVWCTVGCPGYDPREDPAVTGMCEICGSALYAMGAVRCEECEEVTDNGIE
jgi:hypothetical protein